MTVEHLPIAIFDDETVEVPDVDFAITWCEAFDVEFLGVATSMLYTRGRDSQHWTKWVVDQVGCEEDFQKLLNHPELLAYIAEDSRIAKGLVEEAEGWLRNALSRRLSGLERWCVPSRRRRAKRRSTETIRRLVKMVKMARQLPQEPTP